MDSTLILWIYIIILVIGGIMGYVKGKSVISLVMGLVFGFLLSLIALGKVRIDYLEDILLVILLIVFGIRFAKTRKFMPGGLMLILTAIVLILHHLN